MSHKNRVPGLWLYVLIVGAALSLAVFHMVQTWPHNAIGYAIGASQPFSTATVYHVDSTLQTSHTAQTSVVGRPSLSPAFVNQILQAAHSPAQGTGQALYDLSVRSGINDAYALAFFKHESRYGTTGIAQATLSLGNVRCSSGYRCIGGYRAYDSWQAGYADWYALILTLYIRQWHLTTPAQIIPVYAPASDNNDPPAYIADVNESVSVWNKGEVLI